MNQRHREGVQLLFFILSLKFVSQDWQNVFDICLASFFEERLCNVMMLWASFNQTFQVQAFLHEQSRESPSRIPHKEIKNVVNLERARTKNTRTSEKSNKPNCTHISSEGQRSTGTCCSVLGGGALSWIWCLTAGQAQVLSYPLHTWRWLLSLTFPRNSTTDCLTSYTDKHMCLSTSSKLVL